jgi:hypothetical protein
LPLLNDYTFDLQHPLVDGKWQYWQLGVRGNRGRRFPVLYPDLPDANPQLKAPFDQSYQRIVTFPLRPALFVLDRDVEFLRWYGPPPRDFHPRLPGFCSLDVMSVQGDNVPRLIERIERVPRTMTEAFLRMYESELNMLLAIPPGSRSPAQNARIAELQQNIAILEAFLATL